MSKGIHKPASRITLEDLFGPDAAPTEADIQKVAKEIKKPKRRDPSKPTVSPDRLDAIKEAAARCNTTPSWAKTWHPTARVYVEARIHCLSCHSVWFSPGSRDWLVEYTNSRNGSTHTTDPAGPLDKRLPIKKFTHEETAAVCSLCFHGLVTWPPREVTILKLEHLK